MEKTSLTTCARELLSKARGAANGRASDTLVGGHNRKLRHTVIAMRKGCELGEHESPGEATIYVLEGDVALIWGTEYEVLTTGDLATIPHVRHKVDALEDAVIILTVAKVLTD